MELSNNKCILIGVTGGIAVYKVCSLVSSLKKQGFEVNVLMSKEAQEFVTPLTFQTLSGQKVITDMFTTDYTPDVHHISLAKKADAFIIAPATANVIAKVANGLADDFLTTTFLAANCPKMIVPAMNTGMLTNPITQDNIEKCKHYGMKILTSNSGYLACGDVGNGRLPEPNQIEDAIKELLYTNKFLKGKKILITAGPTQESLDPVRYITNHSTGKMGYALARACRNAGADVTLVSGQTNLEDIRDIDTTKIHSAKEMADAVLEHSDEYDGFILSAAVADYTPISYSENKIHKKDGDLAIPVQRTTDILASLGKKKRDNQVIIGFSMETENLEERSKEKRIKKNCDYIVGNSIASKNTGFASDTNSVIIFGEKESKKIELMSKDDVAQRIVEYCFKEF